VSDGPVHIHPTAELAPRALLPGDPGRALMLAQQLLVEPAMFNHNRGLWGYTGAAKADGEPLTIQSTGLGGPSAAIVLEELCDLGLEVAVRVGVASALDGALGRGELVVADAVLSADGTSRALGASERVAPDERLTDALADAGAHRGLIVSADLFYDPDAADNVARWQTVGAIALDLEAAAVLRVAQLRGLRAACLVALGEITGGERLDHDGLRVAGERLGDTAIAALTAV
jgi:uridine phosphorylase